MSEPYQLTFAEAVTLIEGRHLSPVELTQSLLLRIDRLQPVLKAWAYVDSAGALAEARRLERTESRKELQGVAFAAKDIFYTKGIPTEAGAKTWRGFVPDEDAAPVARLRRSGAVLLGKTVTTAFAAGDPVSTVNPWNARRTPGGSSTGSAVAVAARMVPAALGSQTVGSVLRPAAYNGVVGFKPTFGRISRHGVVPQATSLDHVGVLCRSVEDAALLLSVLAGYDPADAASADAPAGDYLSAVRHTSAAPRIGLLRGWFTDEADPETRAHMEAVCRRLSSAGAMVDDAVTGIDFPGALAAHQTIQQAETAEAHRMWFPGHEKDYAPLIRRMIERGMARSVEDYQQALAVQRAMGEGLDRALEDFDVLLTPTVAAPAPSELSTTGDLRFQSLWTLSGMPAISIPTGLSKEGLPLAVQMGAGRFEEPRLLAAARWCEQVLDARLPIPPLAL